MRKISLLSVLLLAAFNLFGFTDDNGIRYDLDATNHTATVTGCAASASSITIPSTIQDQSDTYTVTAIAEDAFYMKSTLTNVVISDGITTIGDYAFYGCQNLVSLSLPQSVTTMGSAVFGYIFSITHLTYDIVNINRTLDFYLQNNSSLTIGSHVTSLANVTFHGGSSIIGITCMATTPPHITTSTFESYETYLYVPYSSISTYSNANIWRNFTNIHGYGTPHTINVYSNDPAKGIVEGSGTYDEGETITIKAFPALGYAFNGWTDGDLNNPRTITVTQDSSFTAIFASATDTLIIPDTIYIRDTVFVRDTLIDTLFIYETDTVYLEYDSTAANQYTLEDYGVYYFMNMVVNRDGIYLRLYAADGKLLNKGTGNFDLTYYANGIYIVTDGKGGFLKIVHYKE